MVIESATNCNALAAYVDRYHPNCNGVLISKDLHRDNAIIMEASVDKLDDGVVIFSPIYAIGIY